MQMLPRICATDPQTKDGTAVLLMGVCNKTAAATTGVLRVA